MRRLLVEHLIGLIGGTAIVLVWVAAGLLGAAR